VYDNLAKLDGNYAKLLTDTISKVKKQIDAAKAVLSGTNATMNTLEAQIRTAVSKLPQARHQHEQAGNRQSGEQLPACLWR